LVFARGTSDLNVRHKEAMAYMNLMNLYRDRFQDIQDFHDQYVAMRKVCDELDLHLGRCESDARAILQENGKTNPMSEQLKKAMNKIEEEHHDIRSFTRPMATNKKIWLFQSNIAHTHLCRSIGDIFSLAIMFSWYA